LEAAILAATDGRQPNARWAGQSCARAFTEKLRILTQHLTTPTDDPLPRFFRLADADPYLRHYLFGRQRPETRIETQCDIGLDVPTPVKQEAENQ
jgi:hypothetical protein